MTMVDYLHSQWHWQQKSYRGENAYGPCPFHQGMTLKWGQKPDFVIYPPEHSKYNDWHGVCYGSSCQVTCDFTGLVWRLEFPDIAEDDKVGWATKIFPRMAQLGETIQLPRRAPLPPLPRVEKPAPTEEQKLLLSAAMLWWHWVLSQTKEGEPGRDYLALKGIDHLPYPLAVGYAPKMTRSVWRTFEHVLSTAFDTPLWRDLGVSVGLLTPGGTARLQERVVYSCVDEEGKAVFYQARTIHDGSSRRAMFLNPSLSKTRPFSVPVKHPAREGVVVTESPKGPTILAQHGIQGLATLGSGLPSSLFRGVGVEGGGPVFVATDNDAPRVNTRTGEVTFPGEALAEKVREEARRAGLATYRLLPPREYKDVDAWVHARGIEPLLQEMDRLSSPKEKG